MSSTNLTVSASPDPFVGAQNLLTNLAGGGVGAAVLAVLFLAYKFFQNRRIKTHSGCIDFELGGPESPQSFRVRRRPTPDSVSVTSPSTETVKVGSGASVALSA